MSHRTSTDLLVLHTLRCIGFVTLPRVAEATGLPESDIESELIDLAVEGLVTREYGGWGLTDAGKSADALRITAELDATGTRPVVVSAFETFLVLNPELLDLCTAWQSRPSNNPEHDTRVLDRLTDLHRRVVDVLGPLSSALHRFSLYRPRLTHAIDSAKAGSPTYVTTTTDSYHSIWFQLHEDLLTTLNIPRH